MCQLIQLSLGSVIVCYGSTFQLAQCQKVGTAGGQRCKRWGLSWTVEYSMIHKILTLYCDSYNEYRQVSQPKHV